MTKKLDAILQVTMPDYPRKGEIYKLKHARVKVEGRGFPYIIIDNVKMVIKSTDFPREFNNAWGFMKGTIDIVKGLDILAECLKNPQLTLDRLSVKQTLRVA